jgi:hypothetical protein
MTNIVSECRSANIVRDHEMILPEDATPKPDGIFGKDKAITEPAKTNNRTGVPSRGAKDIGRGSAANTVARRAAALARPVVLVGDLNN